VIVIRFALDQNLPPFVLDLADLFPDAELAPLRTIDPRLCDLDDRKLVIALQQLGWHGLVTTNEKMLRSPRELAAIIETKIAVYAVQGVGDDPLRATGAILLHLPAVLRRVVIGTAQVFRANPRPPSAEDPWEYIRQAAAHKNTNLLDFYGEVAVTDEELTTLVL
jgi:hypothetical protein